MPNPENGGNQPPQEISMEKRLLLAFLLMGGVMFLSNYLFKSQTPPPKKADQKTEQKTAETGSASSPNPPQNTDVTPPEPTANPTPAGPATTAQVAPPLVIDTELFHIVFSNQGATVRSWQLKKYKGNDNKPLELTNPVSGLPFPFSLHFPAQKPATDVNWAWFTQTADPDGLGVTYEYSDGHTAVKKVFRFEKNSYLSRVSNQVTIDGKAVPAMLQWRGGFGDLTITNPSGGEHTLYFNLTENKLHEQNAGAAKNGPATAAGNFSFGGIADTYFAAVFLPEDTASAQIVTFSDYVRTPLEEATKPFTGFAVSAGTESQFELFVGPKDVDLLAKINPKLTQVVDFGWMSLLAKPLFLVVNWFNDAFVHNFGWSIVLVTIVINFVLFPLKLSNMKSMRKMQALKPQIDAINDKYKSVKMTDPRAADKNQEVMDLYKKHGVNPMGGCLPMALQIPFFIAFYRVFSVSVEMRGAPWLWIHDLSQADPYLVLPIIMIISQFVMQKMTPQANVDPNQQRMMMFMPIVFGIMFYKFAAGVLLYYLTSNLVGVGQQWFFNHTEAAQEAARSVEPPKKKNGRK